MDLGQTRTDQLPIKVSRALHALEELFPYVVDPSESDWNFSTNDLPIFGVRVTNATQELTSLLLYDRRVDRISAQHINGHIDKYLNILEKSSLGSIRDFDHRLIAVETALSVSASILMQPNSRKDRSSALCWLRHSAATISDVLQRTPQDIAGTLQAAIVNALVVFGLQVPPEFDYGSKSVFSKGNFVDEALKHRWKVPIRICQLVSSMAARDSNEISQELHREIYVLSTLLRFWCVVAIAEAEIWPRIDHVLLQLAATIVAIEPEKNAADVMTILQNLLNPENVLRDCSEIIAL